MTHRGFNLFITLFASFFFITFSDLARAIPVNICKKNSEQQKNVKGMECMGGKCKENAGLEIQKNI